MGDHLADFVVFPAVPSYCPILLSHPAVPSCGPILLSHPAGDHLTDFVTWDIPKNGEELLANIQEGLKIEVISLEVCG